jgi:hypothetical protein
MRILFLVFIVTCLCGCRQPQPASTNSPKTDPANSLSEEDQVLQIKQKLHLLQPGMTLTQAISTLGLQNNMPITGGGPISHYWTTYQLNQHHNIIFFSDYTHTNPVLVQIELDGESWTNSAANPH